MVAANNISTLTQSIRNEALRLGFMACGFSKIRELKEVESHYNHWISSGYHASMAYMERNTEKRLNPALLVENSKSVISLLFNYYTPDAFIKSPVNIARYAYGEDYHDVVKDKLKKLDVYIRSICDQVEQRFFIDSAPVLERVWAQQSGLGWIGKNTCLISRRHGSFFFIAEIITSLELEYDEPITDYCGTCNKCVDACPTQAILPGKLIDSNKCISYQTIENREEIPGSLNGKFNKYIFGCDICQDVCPWNSRSQPHSEPLFGLRNPINEFSADDWKLLDIDRFNAVFNKTAVKRTKFEGLKRNILFLENDLDHLDNLV